MKKKRSHLSSTRINRIKEQGYQHLSDLEINDLAFGNRFAYRLCAVILITAVITGSVPLLSAMGVIAFLGVVTPYHPFDHIYNFGVRKYTKGPKLPPRSKQLKFACSIAALWIIATTYFFASGQILAGQIAGSMLSGLAVLVSTTDICIPSITYNRLFNKKKVSRELSQN